MIVINNMQSVWTVLLAPYFLKEYPNCLVISMIAITIFGVVLLVDPNLLLPASLYEPPVVSANNEYAHIPLYYYLIPVSTGISAACVAIYLKVFSSRITVYQNLFFFMIFGNFYVGMCSNIHYFSQTNEVKPSIKDIICLTVAGLCVAFF